MAREDGARGVAAWEGNPEGEQGAGVERRRGQSRQINPARRGCGRDAQGALVNTTTCPAWPHATPVVGLGICRAVRAGAEPAGG